MKNNTISFSLHAGHEAETNIKFRVTVAGTGKNQSHVGLSDSGLEGKSDEALVPALVFQTQIWGLLGSCLLK